jgi:hypothetical protein
MGSIGHRLVGVRVATAGIGPKPATMVFGKSPPLKQHFALPVKKKNAKRPMQMRHAMSLHFLHGTYSLILFIYQYYQGLLHHVL